MGNIVKVKLAEAVSEKVSNAESMFLVEYKGVDANSLNVFRKNIKDSEGETIVVKNKIMRFAVKDTDYESLSPNFVEQTAYVMAYKDPAATAKAVYEFAKENANLKIRCGMLGGKEIDAAQIEHLATLPTKDEMIAMLLRTFNGPVSGFANVLAGVIRKFLYALNAVKEQKN
jgi:large subunit ribosomal protein L10